MDNYRSESVLPLKTFTQDLCGVKGSLLESSTYKVGGVRGAAALFADGVASDWQTND